MTLSRFFLVRFEPSGRTVVTSPGASLLEAARRANLELSGICNGQGECGECRIMILEGQVNPLTQEEHERLPASMLQSGGRLACCVQILN
jgi:ferredoxin